MQKKQEIVKHRIHARTAAAINNGVSVGVFNSAWSIARSVVFRNICIMYAAIENEV